jgi:hypothetical protein
VEVSRLILRQLENSYQCILSPCDTLGFVGIGVLEALDLTGLTTEQAVEVGANLVPGACFESVALCATSLSRVSRGPNRVMMAGTNLEQVGALLVVT